MDGEACLSPNLPEDKEVVEGAEEVVVEQGVEVEDFGDDLFAGL